MVNHHLNYDFIDRIKQCPFVEAMILFGSRACGDQNERSDIDLALVCPDATQNDWQTILKILENKDTLLKVDAIRYDKLEVDHPLKSAIDRDGIVFYRRH